MFVLCHGGIARVVISTNPSRKSVNLMQRWVVLNPEFIFHLLLSDDLYDIDSHQQPLAEQES